MREGKRMNQEKVVINKRRVERDGRLISDGGRRKNSNWTERPGEVFNDAPTTCPAFPPLPVIKTPRPGTRPSGNRSNHF